MITDEPFAYTPENLSRQLFDDGANPDFFIPIIEHLHNLLPFLVSTFHTQCPPELRTAFKQWLQRHETYIDHHSPTFKTQLRENHVLGAKESDVRVHLNHLIWAVILAPRPNSELLYNPWYDELDNEYLIDGLVMDQLNRCAAVIETDDKEGTFNFTTIASYCFRYLKSSEKNQLTTHMSHDDQSIQWHLGMSPVFYIDGRLFLIVHHWKLDTLLHSSSGDLFFDLGMIPMNKYTNENFGLRVMSYHPNFNPGKHPTSAKSASIILYECTPLFIKLLTQHNIIEYTPKFYQAEVQPLALTQQPTPPPPRPQPIPQPIPPRPIPQFPFRFPNMPQNPFLPFLPNSQFPYPAQFNPNQYLAQSQRQPPQPRRRGRKPNP
jgi:hypothetical protein